MLTAEFFEKYPLYRKYKMQQLPDDIQKVKVPAIRSFCPVCQSENTFTGILSLVGPRQSGPTIAGKVASAHYFCASCNHYSQFFQLYFDESLSFIIKTGQFPAWSVLVEKNLSTILGEHEDIYRKGLICEGQGYGIGAYAYYRRVVESNFKNNS
jgi:hypothetical protein